jgi:hypothetical protein
MNCGLGNLDSLKKYLLASTIQQDTRFDTNIKAIGLGIAGLFDTFCNRKFAYADNLTQIFSGDRDHWYMPNYPVVSFSKVELRYFKSDAWTNVSGQPLAVNEETGLLHFGYTLGRSPIQVRVTWSGGYWFEQLEPDDAGYPSAPPAAVAAATAIEPAKFALPDVIKSAWLFQCAEVWKRADKLGVNLIEKESAMHSREHLLDLVPLVESMIQPFKRYQIS